ncbi:helix-turn-helix transcriptional regulator [Kitasatospora purpeofusca]|uniref:helix-turn-helix transcriptional regulator n=1 Tax=Kitasatospora purpeofusca TaxID=67352 RepID=UPI0035D843C4
MTHTPWHIRMARRHGPTAVLYSALALSAPGEFALGVMAGWDARVAWLMPAVLSLYAAISARNSREWSDLVRELEMRGDDDRAADAKVKRGRATRGALLALILATAAQITEHVLTTGATGATAWVVIVVSAVPPLVAAHVLHLDPPEDVEESELHGTLAPADVSLEPTPAPWKPELNKRPVGRPILPAKPRKLPAPEERVTLKTAADRLGVHVTTLYRRRDAGEFPVHAGPRGQLVLWSDVQPENAL